MILEIDTEIDLRDRYQDQSKISISEIDLHINLCIDLYIQRLISETNIKTNSWITLRDLRDQSLRFIAGYRDEYRHWTQILISESYLKINLWVSEISFQDLSMREILIYGEIETDLRDQYREWYLRLVSGSLRLIIEINLWDPETNLRDQSQYWSRRPISVLIQPINCYVAFRDGSPRN